MWTTRTGHDFIMSKDRTQTGLRVVTVVAVLLMSASAAASLTVPDRFASWAWLAALVFGGVALGAAIASEVKRRRAARH